jgi:hypothetical protein
MRFPKSGDQAPCSQAESHLRTGVIRPMLGVAIEHPQEAQLSLRNAVGAPRLPRVRIRRRRLAAPPGRLDRLNAGLSRTMRARRLSAVSVRARPRPRIRDVSRSLPLGVELVRVVILLAFAVFAVIVALPALVEFASAPFH